MPSPTVTRTTSFNNLFDQKTFDDIKSLGKPHFEGLDAITEADVDKFLRAIRSKTDAPLTECLRMSRRDGTIALSHKKQINIDGVNQTCIINVFTAVQDYTRRSGEAFDHGWSDLHSNKNVVQPEHIPTVVQNVSEAQRFLLKSGYFLEGRFEHPSAYLHTVRRDPVSDPSGTIVYVYTVETAYRFAKISDSRVVPFGRFHRQSNFFPYHEDYSRIACSNSEITMWAICHLVRAHEQYDAERLEIIKKCHKAATATPPRDGLNPIDPLNTYELLKCRASGYQDGRARYPVLRAILKSNSIVKTNQAMPTGLKRDDRVTIELKCSNVANIIAVVMFTFLLAFAAYYAISLVCGTRTEVLSIFLIVISYAVASRMITGSIKFDTLFQRERDMTAKELVDNAEGKSDRYQYETLISDKCLEYFHGKGLSWTGREYRGETGYTKRKWKASDLYKAGFDMTYCRDGREALLLPIGDDISSSRTVLRMCDCEISRQNVSFEEVNGDSPAPFMRGNEERDEKLICYGVWKGSGSHWKSDIDCY